MKRGVLASAHFRPASSTVRPQSYLAASWGPGTPAHCIFEAGLQFCEHRRPLHGRVDVYAMKAGFGKRASRFSRRFDALPSSESLKRSLKCRRFPNIRSRVTIRLQRSPRIPIVRLIGPPERRACLISFVVIFQAHTTCIMQQDLHILRPVAIRKLIERSFEGEREKRGIIELGQSSHSRKSQEP